MFFLHIKILRFFRLRKNKSNRLYTEEQIKEFHNLQFLLKTCKFSIKNAQKFINNNKQIKSNLLIKHIEFLKKEINKLKQTEKETKLFLINLQGEN